MIGRGRAVAVVALALVAGCKSDGKAGKGKAAPPAAGLGNVSLDKVVGGVTDPLPTRDVAGPAVTPVATSTVTFVVPKDDVTWVEWSFPCYAAAATMSSGGRAATAIEGVSPLIPQAMAAAGVDLEQDLVAIGGFACGEAPCIYLAVRLREPARVKDALAVIPGVDVAVRGDGHYSFGAPGAGGPRDIHVRVLPVRWTGGVAPSDPWTTWQTRATHVVFLGGLVAGGADVDPLTAILPPDQARAKVAATEGVVADPRGRCVVGTLGRQADVKPGFTIERGRFAMAAPGGKADALTRLMGSQRSLDAEVELTMTPAPSEADVARWIDETRTWAAGIAGPIRQEYAAAGPAVDVVFDMVGALVDHGFRSQVKGSALSLSWRTDRVPASALEELERRAQGVLGTP